jgi:fibronectin type III domain protein
VLSWQDNSGNETSFRIERCQNAGCTSFAQVATTGPNTGSFVDTGLARKTTYVYRVRAANANGSSAYSNTATAKTGN